MAITGNQRVIEYRKTPGTGDWIVASGAGSGLGDIDIGETTNVVEVPGEGEQTTRKALSVKNATYAMPAQKTDTTRALFGTFRRQRIEFRVSAEGNATGQPYKQFILYLFSRITAPVNGPQEYTVSYAVDGAIVNGAHA